MSAHTPGPWKLSQESVDPEWHIISAGVRLVANVHIETGNRMDAANALVMVSSPDLLDVLKRIMAWERDMEAGKTAFSYFPGEQARAAIAKAEGRA